jgi:hypothetical protein
VSKPVWDDFSSSYREHVLGRKEVRNRCLVCDKVVDLPGECPYCKGIYCEEHVRPELHNCKGLSARGWSAYKALKMGEKTTPQQNVITPNYKRPNLFGKRPIDTPIQPSTEQPSIIEEKKNLPKKEYGFDSSSGFMRKKEEKEDKWSEKKFYNDVGLNGPQKWGEGHRKEKTKGYIKRATILKIFVAIFLILIGITAVSFIRLSSSQIIKVDKLQVSPSEALSGDPIYVSVSFKSYIDDQGDPIILFVKGIKPLQNFFMNYISSKKEFDIKVDGGLLTKKDIILDVDKTYNYTFPVLNKIPGRHIISINNTLCEFIILNQSRFDGVNFKIQPDPPSIGEDIIISVDVTNVGAIIDTKNIQLYINSYKIEESQINLTPSQNKTIKFTISEEKMGNYNITLNGLSNKFVRIIQITNVIDAITGKYKNYYLGLVKSPGGVEANSYGDFIILINNKNAKDPTYSQLLDFLRSDKTDQYPYKYVFSTGNSYYGSAESNVNLVLIKEIIDSSKQPNPPRVCADFAEMLHNNAENAGIRCAFISIGVGGSGHALNAFSTTDRELVYIDDTGYLGGLGPSNCDKIVDVLKIGSSYIPRSLFPEPGWSSTWENAGTVTSIYMTWDGEWGS